MEIKKIGAAACGSIAFLFALIAVSTEGWWSSNTVNHGLWTATVNNQKEKIFIGLDIGYRGLETVRGFNIISVLVLFSGLCTSIISFIPKFASSSQAGIWIHAVSAIFIIFAIGAASAIDPTMKMNSRDFSYGYSYALSHCSWILSSIAAGLFFWHTIDEASDAY